MLRLIDICELIVDCEHKTAPTQEDGYPSIRTPNIGRGRLILEGVNRVSEDTYHAWTQREVPMPGDLILAREAPIGNVAIIPSGLKVCLGQRTVLIRANRRLVSPRYLTYLLLGDEIQGRLQSVSNGATVHHLNVKDIRDLEMPVMPNVTVQERIASILSAYDDLIENNTRRIKILEEMSQRLYQEWFVNFRFPGHEKVAMVESELGPIPEGWGRRSVAELLESSLGGDWGSDSLNDEDSTEVYVIRGTDFDDLAKGAERRSPKRFISPSSARRRILRPGDILVENSVNAKSRCTGKPFLVDGHTLRRFSGNCIAASFCKVFRPRDESIAPLLYLHMEHLYRDGRMMFYQNVAANGIGNFQSSRFIESERLALPERAEEMKALSSRLESFLKMRALLAREEGLLRTTRDLLLPKLISGEIPVEAAEEAMETIA